MRFTGEETWYAVSLPHATFAFAARQGRVIEAAPIARKSIGRDVGDVIRYFRSRGGRVLRLHG